MPGNLPLVTDVIPHRSPFLFLDEITGFDPDRASAEGRWLARPDADFFEGHFPDRPMVPGVILTEAIAQLGAYCIITLDRTGPEPTERIPLFGGIDKVRFRRMVEPGDLVNLHIELTRMSARAGRGTGTASVDGELAANAELFFVMA